MYSHDVLIVEMFNGFHGIMALLLIECTDFPNCLYVDYYYGIFYYLQALYNCGSEKNFLKNVMKRICITNDYFHLKMI